MEHFFYDGEFYHSLEDFIQEIFEDESEISELPDDKIYECRSSNLEPIVQLDASWIVDRIDEDRFSENESEIDNIRKILNECIDFESINTLLPKLYYEGKFSDRFTITKQDLLRSL